MTPQILLLHVHVVQVFDLLHCHSRYPKFQIRHASGGRAGHRLGGVVARAVARPHAHGQAGAQDAHHWATGSQGRVHPSLLKRPPQGCPPPPLPGRPLVGPYPLRQRLPGLPRHPAPPPAPRLCRHLWRRRRPLHHEQPHARLRGPWRPPHCVQSVRENS